MPMKEYENFSGSSSGDYKYRSMERPHRKVHRPNKTKTELGSSSSSPTTGNSFNFAEFSTNTTQSRGVAASKDSGGLSRSLDAKPWSWSFGGTPPTFSATQGPQTTADGTGPNGSTQGAPQAPLRVANVSRPGSGETSSNAINKKSCNENDALKINATRPPIPPKSHEMQTCQNKLQIATENGDYKVPTELKETSNPVKETKVSPVYKCNACGLCFDQPELLLKHLNTCSPSAKMIKIHCICGLVFDKNNFPHHSSIHREFTKLNVKKIVVRDEGNIDVSGMGDEFIEDEEQSVERIEAGKDSVKTVPELIAERPEETVGKVVERLRIEASKSNDTSISSEKEGKASLVYKCQCRLCFDRPEFFLKHLNICSPSAKIVKIFCICGLVFDKHNFTYHCEVHRDVNKLSVKEIIVSDDGNIDVSEMAEEFADDEMEVGTVDQNKTLLKLKSSVAKHVFGRKGTNEEAERHQIVSAAIETINSGVDGEEKQTMITIIIAQETENDELPNTTNTDDYKTIDTQNAKDGVTAQNEQGDKINDNKETSEIAAILQENKIDDTLEPSDKETNENTVPIQNNKELEASESEIKGIDSPGDAKVEKLLNYRDIIDRYNNHTNN